MSKKKVESYKHRPLYQKILMQLGVMLASIFLLYAVITNMIVDSAVVSSRAMIPGLISGDRIVISRIPLGMSVPFFDVTLPPMREPKYGSVVAVRSPFESNAEIPVLSEIWNFISLNNRAAPQVDISDSVVLRRVIALPGDRIYVSAGRAFVQPGSSGDFLEESLLSNSDYFLNLPSGEFDSPDLLSPYYIATTSVPEGFVYLLPDNRIEALGSNGMGMTSIEQLKGTVIWQY